MDGAEADAAMIYGIGTDLIEVERLEALAERGTAYLEKIFTAAEISYCENHGRKAEHLAARFAAKEAFLKALGTGLRDGLSFTEIEVFNDELGKPYLRLHGKAKDRIQSLQISHISISLSHIKEIAMAVAILEKQA
ncbi:MAG: holo-ACP synthase [Anaerolineaceae bacterium]